MNSRKLEKEAADIKASLQQELLAQRRALDLHISQIHDNHQQVQT
jgi:post-segregation antitoxin (ccd killing protein)